MKNIIRISASIIGLSLLVLLFQNYFLTKPDSYHTAYTEGMEDGVSARKSFEYQMIRDPKTGLIPIDYKERELQRAQTLLKSSPINSLEDVWVKPWMFSGPNNVGGRTRALAYDVRNENIMIAGGVSSGIFRSVDGGLNWTKSQSNAPRHSVTCLVQDIRVGKEDIWYYGTGERLGNTANAAGAFYRGSGIYKSTDNGITWERLNSTAPGSSYSLNSPFQYIYNIIIDHTIQGRDVVYAACVGSIQFSSDGGQNWAAVLGRFSNEMADATDICIHPDGDFYASFSRESLQGGESPDGGFYESFDGINFDLIPDSDIPPLAGRSIIKTTSNNNDDVYFLTSTPNHGVSDHKLQAYSRLTGTWVDLSNNLPATDPYKFDSQVGYDLCMACSPVNPDQMLIGGTSLYLSASAFRNPDSKLIGGYDFNNVPLPLIENSWVDYHLILFSKDTPEKVLVACDGGVRYIPNINANTLQWEQLNNLFTTSQFYSVSIDKSPSSTNPIMVGGLQDKGSFIGVLEEQSTDWPILPVSGDGGVAQVTLGGDLIYVSTQRGRIYQIDRLSNPMVVNEITPSGANPVLFITPYTLDGNDNALMYYAGGNYLWRNSALTLLGAGDSFPLIAGWERLNFSLTTSAISAVEVSKTPADVVYYGTTEGSLYRIANGRIADPFPVNISSDIFPDDAYISSICINPKDANKVLITFSNYNVNSIFYTDDAGQNWRHVGGNLNEAGVFNPSVRACEIIHDETGKAFYLIGTSIGIYGTNDLNVSPVFWEPQGLDATGFSVVVDFDSRTDGYVIAATHGNGVFQAKIAASFGLGEIADKNPFGAHVYPNPIIGSTAFVEVELEKPINMRVMLYDQIGRLIQIPINHELPIGLSKLSIPMANMPAGMYNLVLESKDTRQSIRLLK